MAWYNRFSKFFRSDAAAGDETEAVAPKSIKKKHGSAPADPAAKRTKKNEPEKNGNEDRELLQVPKESFYRIREIIKPEERTLKNYVSFHFWVEKKNEYARIREKEKIDLNVFEVLADGARPSIEYYVLTILSCVIATTGLLQGSTATIIGAMIVAPLMTPILAFSLGVIWGDLALIKTSISSLFKGIIIAILISAAIAYIVPVPILSQEIISRTRPTLFDIIVAFASGLVGAYGNANKKIVSTLTGIAIAVALMPPLCTIGIGIGKLNLEITRGASILFLINLVCISLAGALIFWMMKIHPIMVDASKVARRAMYQIVISLAILTAISIPVGLYMMDGYRIATSMENVRKSVGANLPGLRVFNLEAFKEKKGYQLKLILTGHDIPERGKIEEMKSEILNKNAILREISVSFIKSTDL